MGKSRKHYDVFISYRREGGSELAKQLMDSLTHLGYSVFLDVESLRNGPFNVALYDIIDNAKDFLLILPPHGLDRCSAEDDWVRLEIERAAEKKKNIVPIRMAGFEFPDDLPPSIDFIRLQNGPTATDIEYYDAYVERLCGFLDSRPMPKWRRRLIVAVVVVLIAAIGSGIYYCKTIYPLWRSDKNVVSSLISYMSQNLIQMDSAGITYLKGLDRAKQFVDGTTTDSKSTIQYELTHYIQDIDSCVNALSSMPSGLRSDLLQSNKFDLGDLEAMNGYLSNIMKEYSDNLEYVKSQLIDGSELRTEYKSTYLGIIRSMAELDAENIFYALNDSLLSVTNDEALKVLKTDVLPKYSFLNSKRLDLTHDEDSLSGKLDAVYKQQQQLMNTLSEAMDREASYLDIEGIQQLLAFVRDYSELTGVDSSELEARLEHIIEMKQDIDDKKAEYSESADKLKELKEEAYEKFKPSEDDDPDTLWGKGTRFMTIKMPVPAAECFKLFAEKSEGNDQIYGTAAMRFAENCTALGLTGGVVVGLYEEGLPHQAVEIGDIIYAVDCEPITNYTEYSAAYKDDGFTISILRFDDAGGYTQLESTIDPTLGRIGLRALTDEPE